MLYYIYKNVQCIIVSLFVDAIDFMVGIKKYPPVPTNYKPYVTVLVPAYNEEAVIRDTLESLAQQTYKNIREIIVIDDCSSDRTSEIAKELGATVVKTPQNTGTKSRAQNYAIPFVKTPVFVTIDADTTLDPRAIDRIIPFLYDGQTLSACGFVIPQVIHTFWERARTAEYLYGLGLFKSAQEHVSMPLVSSGCFSAFNLKLFKNAGMFPENNIAEDMALTWKAHLMGYKIKYVSDAICYPKEPATWVQYKGQLTRWYRGFFQCISDYKTSLLRNPKLAAFVLFYLIMGLISPLWLFFAIWYGYLIASGGTPSLFSLAVIGVFLVDVVVGYTTTIIKGKQTNKLIEAVTGYPLLWLISPLNSCLFLYSMAQEWLMKNKLTNWEKGH